MYNKEKLILIVIINSHTNPLRGLVCFDYEFEKKIKFIPIMALKTMS